MTRQRDYQNRRRAEGGCTQCPAKAMLTGGLCLRCHAKRALRKNRLWGYLTNNAKRREKLFAALEGRYAAVLLTEGFNLKALGGAEEFIARNAGDWVRSAPARRKLARIIDGLDDRAVRYRMRAAAKENVH